MIEMSTWRELVVDVVDDVRLDPRNVRIELNDGFPEADIIQDLFHNEKALALVESICKVGLLTHELPIAIERDGELVIVEGNRRVAALKAIQNPYLTPEFQARITRFVGGIDRHTLRKITVKVAPSQDAADQLIAAIHTGNQRVGWSPTRQAAFFQAQIDAGKTTEYLISHYPTVDVKKFVIRSQILNLFRDVDYIDPQLKDYVKTRNFPISVLARLYDNEKFLELAQIDVDEHNTRVDLVAPRKQFARIAEKVIGDIKTKRINTRTLNSARAQSYIDYMNELRDLIDEYPDSQQGDTELTTPTLTEKSEDLAATASTRLTSGSTTSAPESTEAAPSPVPLKVPEKATDKKGEAKPKAANSNYLNLTSVVVATSFPPAIHQIHSELSGLNIRKFPNAAFDLLRTFLEKTIKAYAESLGENIRNTSNQGGFVQLSHCLTWLEGHLRSQNRKSYLQVISKIRGNALGSAYIPTLDHMNAINHNHEVFASADEVRACWEGMQGLVRMMLKP
ncbi:hypothetical protein ACFU5D_09665 [Streptomyces anthocyanicus]|uniref:hypothetical protein n=1 Tax=Streptomyces anthocyanicus TaxID=68174 RepID=UPI0036879DC1